MNIGSEFHENVRKLEGKDGEAYWRDGERKWKNAVKGGWVRKPKLRFAKGDRSTEESKSSEGQWVYC